MLDCSEEVETAMSYKLPFQNEKMSKILRSILLFTTNADTEWMYFQYSVPLVSFFLELSYPLQWASYWWCPLLKLQSRPQKSLFPYDLLPYVYHTSLYIQSVLFNRGSPYLLMVPNILDRVGGHVYDWSTVGRCRQSEGQSLTV